jgi:8-oxo-dGTP diphosphatase
MITAGIDGCKAGWIMVRHNKGEYTFGIYSSIQELFSENYDLQRALIDIPVGLASENVERTIENALRTQLRHRHSTVFNPPCREALYENSYASARVKNLQVEGKSLSIQSLAIKDKIKETDEFLRNSSSYELIESHPELCFKYLNNGEVVLSKKSTEAGIKERLGILRNYFEEVDQLYQQVIDNTMRKSVKKDDIVDAICLCLVNKLSGRNSMKFITDRNRLDAEGIEMKIAYFDPYN